MRKDLNTEEYWSNVWKVWRHDNKLSYLKAMADRANDKNYWDEIWKSPKRRVEKYSMQRAWWKIQEVGAKSVLDVGCGNGRLLFGVKDKCEVFGIDISETAIARMKKEYGIEGLAMDFYDLDKLDKTFDFIVCNHTLEHTWRDEDLVKLIYNRLNLNGWFYAAVPNNMSGPEETEEHVRKYDGEMFKKLFMNVFGNYRQEVIGNHLIGMAQKTENKPKRLTITSHTIVKNGMPFIIPVLKAVEPLMTKMVITISEKSSDGTREAVEALKWFKLTILYENVSNPSLLTQERQKQVNLTNTDWILFLDDDDYWDIYELDKCLHELSDEVDGLGINPYQMLDKENEDSSWINKKYFTKLFKNDNINYRYPWPRDMIYKGDVLLYWKTNPRVKVVPYRFWHLANLKNYSFRNNDLKDFKYKHGNPILVGKPLPKEIYELLSR